MKNNLLPSIVEKLYNLADRFHSARIKKFYSNYDIDLVIDVGSHKGEFINSIVENHTPIYSFEPQTSVREILVQNTSEKNVMEYFDMALSDKKGTVELYLSELTSTSSIKTSDLNNFWIKFKKLILGGNLYSGKEIVTMSTLDDVLLDKLNPNKKILLKIDTKGSEAEVIKESEKIFSKCQIQFVQIESSNYNIYENINSSPSRILEKLGYKKPARKFLFPILNFQDIVFTKK